MKLKKASEWWSRPAGGREVLLLAVPLIISVGSWAIMTFADRVMLTWYSVADTPQAVTGIATGAAYASMSLFYVLTSIPFGIMMLTNAFVAQYYGAGKPKRIGPIVVQGVFLGMAVFPLYIIAEPLFFQIFRLLKHSPEMIPLEETYLHYALYGVGPLLAGEATAAFFIGRGKMHTVMIVNIIAVATNIVLDYLLIFGAAGFPEWGVAGASIATTISVWLRFLVFSVIILIANGRKDEFCVLQGFRPDFSLMLRLLRFGGPSGVEFFLENLGFGMFSLIMGAISNQAMIATSIAVSLNALSFLPLVGIGIVVMSMVGNYLGRNKPELAHRATETALVLGTVSNGFFVILYLFFPYQLLYAFTMFGDQEAFAPLRDMTVIILRFVSIYLLFDGVNIIFMSAIKGAGDTFYLFCVSLFMAPILPGACYLFVAYGFGMYACWTLLTIWICLFAGFFCWRFYGGKWQSMRVIEQESPKND